MKRVFIAALVVLGCSSCKKNLELAPMDNLTPEQAFANENNLKLYANSFYLMLPDGPGIYKGDVMTDITVPNAVPSYISGKFSPSDATGWSWTNLRNINYFLEHYNNPAIPQRARNHYAGIARFFRAYYYFSMVKQFGEVPWYGHTLPPTDSAIYKARDPRALVMDSVLADINFACENIYEQKDATATQITKWVALAMKSRICLFEGSFRKYHSELSLGSTASFWFQEASAAAQILMQSAQYRLQNTSSAEKDYRTLFISENPVSTEVLLAAVYNNNLRKWHDAGWWYNSATLGARLGLSKSFVNTYLNIDGTPFTGIPKYDTLPFQTEVKNRDKRLTQTIRSGYYKRSDGTTALPDFNVTYSGYQIVKFSLDDKYYDTRTESYNSIPIIRYAEVLLNYAEANAELGIFTESDWNLTIGALRKRAGIPNPQFPATVDAYMQSQFFPEVTDAVLMEIRRERGIELVGEGLRYDDLKRWKAGKLLEKGYDGLYVPGKNLLLDLDENGKPDVCFVDQIPASKVSGVVYFLLDNNTKKLSQGDKGNLLWLGNTPKAYEDKKYFYPIPYNEILLNPKLKQNAGW